MRKSYQTNHNNINHNYMIKFRIHHASMGIPLSLRMEPESLVGDLVKGFIRCASTHNASIASQQLVLCDRAGSEFYFEEDTLQEALGEDIHLPLSVQELSPCPGTAEECIKEVTPAAAEEKGLVAEVQLPKPKKAVAAPAGDWLEKKSKTSKTLTFSKDDIGRLLGKKGSTKDKLQADHGVSIKVRGTSAIVCGDRGAVDKALVAIKAAVAWRPGQPASSKKKKEAVTPLQKAYRAEARQAQEQCWATDQHKPVLPAPRGNDFQQAIHAAQAAGWNVADKQDFPALGSSAK